MHCNENIFYFSRKEFDSLFISRSEMNHREIVRNDSFAINYTLEVSF